MTRIQLHFGRQALWLLFIGGIVALSIGLSNTFVNIYLWKLDKRYDVIGWYNFAVYFCIPLTFVIAGWVAKRRGTVWTLRIGIALHGAFYAITLFSGTAVARYPALLGILMGLSAGFYWLSFNTLVYEYTERGTRERFTGWSGAASAVAGMVAPPVAGFLISYEDRLGGLSGYHVIFALSFGLFILAAFFSLRLHAHRGDDALRLKDAWRSLTSLSWRSVLAACGIYGMREGVFVFLIGLLFYIATGSEFTLGNFILLQSALSFASFYFAGKYIHAKNRVQVLGYAAAGMALAACFFLLPITSRLILYYGSLIAIVLPWFLVPLQGIVLDGISTLGGAGEANPLSMEHLIVRELFQNVGRVLGIGAFLILVGTKGDSRQIALFATGLGFVQLFAWLSIRTGVAIGKEYQSETSVPESRAARLKTRAGRIIARRRSQKANKIGPS